MTPPPTSPASDGQRAPLRLVFMGTPDFAVPALAALIEAGHEILCTNSLPPRLAARGQRERVCPVFAYAAENGNAVRTPKTLRDKTVQMEFAALSADAAIVSAYGLILPRPILDAPRLGCLNIHASLLPRWRGAAPIQRAILAGDTETGVTILQMDAGLDTGGLLLSQSVPITEETTASNLHDSLSKLGTALIVKALDGLDAGTMVATPQPETGMTYAQKLRRDEGRLDWAKPATYLARTVRAFSPWPGAWFEHNGERIKVLEASKVAGASKRGTVLDDELTIACGDDALRLITLQRSGKRATGAAAFIRGYKLPAGTVLS